MPLDPQLQAMRARRAAEDSVPLYEMTVAQARSADLASIRAAAGEPEPVGAVTDREIPGPGGDLPVRVYRPAGDGPFPTLLYFFGGGWTVGCIDTADGVCRRLTNAVGCVTVSVGYRLAPEHKFPAAVEDCHAALRWLAGHPGEVAADGATAGGGDSAGGNLAAVISLLARDRSGPPLRAQLLVYPNTDFDADTESSREHVDRYLFNRHSVDWYWRNYLTSPKDGENPLVSPLRAEHLGGLPPALVITAEYDPLRDEGERYARRLQDAGVPVTLTRYNGMAHGFFTMTGTLPHAERAMTQAADFLRTALAAG